MATSETIERSEAAADLGSPRRNREWTVVVVLTPIVLGVVAWLMGWKGGDLPTQLFRVWLFREGFVSWNPFWYGGHPTPGYSVLFPPIAATVGIVPTALGSAAVASWAFDQLVRARWGTRARWGSLWFAAATITNIAVGRLTFGLGLAVGLLAVLLLQRGHARWAVVLSFACPLASPVAGAFLILAWAAWTLATRRWRTGAWLIGGVLVPMAVITLFFSDGGSFPFTWTGFVGTLAASLVAWWLVSPEDRMLRLGIALYALAAVASFVVPNPMGGNIQRLGMYLIGPLVVCSAVLVPRIRTVALVVLVPALLFWQWSPAYDSMARADDDPSTYAEYYEGVTSYLGAVMDEGDLVEVVPTHRHWESFHVAQVVPLARGWERQLDRRLNPLFYEPALDGGEYRVWLLERGVRYVALPDVDLDVAGVEEGALVASEPAYLELAWLDAHWRVYRVVDTGWTPPCGARAGLAPSCA